MAKIYAIDGVIPVVAPGCFIHPDAILIGDVIVEKDCYIGPAAVLRGDFGRITIRQRANIQDTCVVHSFPGREVIVEEGGHIGHGAVLHGCIIGSNALVGMNSVIMDEVIVGENAFIGAGSFVKSKFEIPPNSLVTGSPAKILRTLSEDEISWKRKGTQQYVELAQRSMASMKLVEPLAEIEPDRPTLKIGDGHVLKHNR